MQHMYKFIYITYKPFFYSHMACILYHITRTNSDKHKALRTGMTLEHCIQMKTCMIHSRISLQIK